MSMECIVCHHCKTFWYQSIAKGESVEGINHPPCQNPIRTAKRPPKEYTADQQKAA